MNTTAISIRPARSDDFTSLWSVATLDSAVLPPEPLMVAEEDGQMVAALSLASGDAVADPFRRTAEAVALLKLRRGPGPVPPPRGGCGPVEAARDPGPPSRSRASAQRSAPAAASTPGAA